MDPNCLVLILYVAFICMYAFIHFFIKYRKMKIVYQYVSWIEYGGIDSTRCGTLIEYVQRIQKKLDILPRYSVLKEDEENVAIILSEFRRSIAVQYFSGRLFKKKLNKRLIEENMFFLWLFEFLEENNSNHLFYSYKANNKIESQYKSEYDDSIRFSEKLELSFLKLKYVVLEYCIKTDELSNMFTITNCDYMEDDIEQAYNRINNNK